MIKHLWPGFSWAFVIFILCAIPGKNLPHYTWADLLSLDKLIHFSMFFVLVVLFKRGFIVQNHIRPATGSFDIFLMVLAMAYGGGLELMQSYCYTDRSGSWFDFLANGLGAIAGVYFFKKLFDNRGKRIFFK